jgi:hypothetical protein
VKSLSILRYGIVPLVQQKWEMRRNLHKLTNLFCSQYRYCTLPELPRYFGKASEFGLSSRRNHLCECSVLRVIGTEFFSPDRATAQRGDTTNQPASRSGDPIPGDASACLQISRPWQSSVANNRDSKDTLFSRANARMHRAVCRCDVVAN